jgi:NADH-quinone oxidoreductase subunit H
MRVCALFWLAVLLSVSGCRLGATAPDLFQVLDLSPRRVDVGDRLELVGTGFPEGKAATVTFVGDVHRPGQEPTRDVQITAGLTHTSHSRVSLLLTEPLQHRFCGVGADARHATFRGDVVVAFSPLKPGAPPVTGTLRDVVLSVAAPPLSREAAARLEEEGQRALRFLGITLTAQSEHEGVRVRAVEPAGPMARAGVLAEDALLEFDGVQVHDAEDLIPAGRSRFAAAVVRRGPLGHRLTRRIEVQGFRPTAPSELAWAAVVVGLAAAIVLLFSAPAAGLLTWAERVVARRLLSSCRRRRDIPCGFMAWLRHALWSMFSDDPLPVGQGVLVLRLVPYLLLLATSAGFTLLAFGLPLVSADLDLGILFAASATAMVTVGLMLGGWRDAGRWSFLAGLRSALQILCLQIPAATGIACAVIMAGSARFDDIVLGQGGAPWQFYLFKNPTLLVTFLLLVATGLPETSRAPVGLPEADNEADVDRPLQHPTSRCLMFCAEWGQVFVFSGFATALFLGGWRVPGVSAAEQQSAIEWQVFGAVLFQVKCWLVVLAVLWTRWVLPRVRVDQMMNVCWRLFIPLGIGTVGLTMAWVSSLKSPILQSTQSLLSVVTFALCLFVAGYFIRRVLLNLRSTDAQVNVNPWL